MKFNALILVAALASAGAAYAQPAPNPERDAMMKICAGDMTTLCAGKTGRDANQCLRDSADKVSPACKDAMSKVPARGGGGGGGGGGGQ